MKNVLSSQLKTCIILPNDEFDRIVSDIYPDDDTDVTYELDGISVSVNDDCAEDLYSRLAEYFDVKEITSIHIDDCEYPIGVWIVYKD